MTDLSSISQPPTGLEMNAAGQTIFTIFVTAIWVVAIALAVSGLTLNTNLGMAATHPAAILTVGLSAVIPKEWRRRSTAEMS